MALGRIALALQSVASVAFVAAGGHQLFPRAARCASWRVALREIPNGLALAAMLGLVGIARISLWQYLGFYDYGEHWMLIALTGAVALGGIVMFRSLAGFMSP